MKKKILPLVFAAVAVFFVSCGNTVSSGKTNKDSKRAIVSFSALVNDGARAGETESLNTVITPTDVTEEDIAKVELKVASVTKAADGTTTETICLFGDETEDEKEKQTFSSIKDFQNATFQLDIGTYTFYLDLFVAQGESEKTEYVHVQSGKITEELKAGENQITINTKYVESGDVSFTFNWLDSESEADSRVAKVKIGLYSGELDSLAEVNDFAPVQVTITNSEGECSAVYNASSVPNGSYQIGVTLLDKKDNLLNTFYYPLTVYGYKSFGSKNIASDYNKNYYITYNYNGGNVVKGKESHFAEVFNQDLIIYLPDSSCIERSGYDFKGWYTSPDFNEDDFVKIIHGPLLAGDNMLSDFTLYAKWTPVVNKTASGTILLDNGSVGYTITMTIDEPFTLNSGSASFDIVLADGTDLVSSGMLANASEEEPYPAFSMQFYYGDKIVNSYAQDENDESSRFVIYKDSETKDKNPAELEEGESLYTKPSFSINPMVPLEAPGMYQIQVLLTNSLTNSVLETFDIPVENKIVYEEDVTESEGKISAFLDYILKNRTHAEVDVKIKGQGVDDTNETPEDPDTVVAGTIHQIASCLLKAGTYIENNINLDLSELKGVTSVPEKCFCTYKNGVAYGKDFASIVLPEGIKEIGEEAFNACSTLSSVTIPKSLTNISYNVFKDCSKLSNIIVAEGNTNFEVRKDEEADVPTMILIEKASSTNSGDTIIWQWFPADAKNITLDYSGELYSGIKAIGNSAYYANNQIKEISSFGHIEVIESHAFMSAKILDKVNLKGVKIVDERAFSSLGANYNNAHCLIYSENCTLCGIYENAFDSECDFNINFTSDSSYYVVNSDSLDSDDWWAEYKAGILAGTMTTEVFEALDWYINVETINDADPEEISIPYTDPGHPQFGWEPDPENPDDTPPEDEVITVDGDPAWKVFKNEKFNSPYYIQFIVPNN